MITTSSAPPKPSSSTSSWFSVWSCSRLCAPPERARADGVELVDEDDRRRVLARLFEELADPGGTEPGEHLDEGRGARRVEVRARLVRGGLGEQRLARFPAGRRAERPSGRGRPSRSNFFRSRRNSTTSFSSSFASSAPATSSQPTGSVVSRSTIAGLTFGTSDIVRRSSQMMIAEEDDRQPRDEEAADVVDGMGPGDHGLSAYRQAGHPVDLKRATARHRDAGAHAARASPTARRRQPRVVEPRVASRIAAASGSSQKSSSTAVPPGARRPTIASTSSLALPGVDEEQVEGRLRRQRLRHDPARTRHVRIVGEERGRACRELRLDLAR